MFSYDTWSGPKKFWIELTHIWSYLSNLQWTERKQALCRFCKHQSLNPIYEDEEIIAFDNIWLAGRHHWLIAPKSHIRDIEELSSADLPLLKRFAEVKDELLTTYCPTYESLTVISGYHRGRRPMIGETYWPDIISVHHLHLHVIVEPRLLLRLFKYPSWLPLMWKSDEQVLRQLKSIDRKDI